MSVHGVISFVAFARNLWKARNKRWFEQEEQSPVRIVTCSISHVNDILKNQLGGINRNKPGRPGEQWSPHQTGNHKLNADVGVFPDGLVGLGFIVRNWEGRLILAGARRCTTSSTNNTLIEALALRFGMTEAVNKDL
ncbi:hypothetical protein ACS0TY_011184 [Phlomoides rotata]